MFCVASLSINLIPGPDVVYIVSTTMKGKFKLGFEASLGLGVGYLVHTFAAVFGLSAIILKSALLFNIVKYFGAAYLLYLGITSLINCYKNKSNLTMTELTDTNKNVFKQGVMISVLNPKVAMFFLAFLPQFVNAGSVNASQELLILGLLFSVLATLCNIVYAYVGNAVLGSAKAARYSRAIEGSSGLLLVGLSAKIALSERV